MISYNDTLLVVWMAQVIFLTVIAILIKYKCAENFTCFLSGILFLVSVSVAIVGLVFTIVESELRILLCFSIPVLAVCAIIIVMFSILEKHQQLCIPHVIAVWVLMFVIDLISVYGGVYKTNEVLSMTTVNISELSTLNKIRLAITMQKFIMSEDSYNGIQRKVISNLRETEI